MPEAVGRRSAVLKHLRALFRDGDLRRSESVAVAEGPNVAIDALATDARIELLAVDRRREHDYQDIIGGVASAGGRVVLCEPGTLDSVAQARSSQGLVSVVARPAPLDRSSVDVAGFLIVATISDPGNAGMLIRAASAFGADGIVLGPGSVDAYNPKTLRASAGAAFSIPIMETDVPISTLLERPRSAGMRCFGASTEGEVASSVDLTGRVAIVLGHERRGIDPDAELDGYLSIPLRAEVDSLNVAAAGTVLAYEVARQRAFPEARS